MPFYFITKPRLHIVPRSLQVIAFAARCTDTLSSSLHICRAADGRNAVKCGQGADPPRHSTPEHRGSLRADYVAAFDRSIRIMQLQNTDLRLHERVLFKELTVLDGHSMLESCDVSSGQTDSQLMIGEEEGGWYQSGIVWKLSCSIGLCKTKRGI